MAEGGEGGQAGREAAAQLCSKLICFPKIPKASSTVLTVQGPLF